MSYDVKENKKMNISSEKMTSMMDDVAEEKGMITVKKICFVCIRV